MNKLTLIVSIFFSISTLNAQINPLVEYFDLQDVELLDSPFKNAQELDKKYLLEMDADRLLAPFLREAGLPHKAESYTNWENTGLDGHIGGHYVSALSLMYASTGDVQIKNRLDYMLSEWKRCQDANGDGYIGGVPGGKAIWEEIHQGNIRAGGFDLNGKWVPLYNIHKTYAGLRDAYLYAKSELAKYMLVEMSDWAIRLVSNLSEEQIQDMLRSEHGGLNETFADVAAITGDNKYLELARRFSHKVVLEPLLNGEDKLTGMHANTQIPKVLGFKRVADVEGNREWQKAAFFFWQTVVQNRSVCIGGNSVSEHFNPVDDFSKVISGIEGPETCNTYNMLRLTRMFFRDYPHSQYVDYYERALYNHILSSQHPERGGLVYFTQMRPGHYRVYSQPHTSMWCCVGSGIENHAKYGEMIYAHSKEQLFINLFIPSKLNWEEKKLELIQQNSFPDKNETKLIFNPEEPVRFDVSIRCPSWVDNGLFEVYVNGEKMPVNQNANGYISMSKEWVKGDVVTIKMPMRLSVEQLPDKSNYYSILYGPLVLAAKTGVEDLKGLYADDSRGGHIAHGKQIPLKDIPIIVSESDKVSSSVRRNWLKPGLSFTLTNLHSNKYPDEMELIPFYKVHDSRYIIYWPQATEDELKDLQKKIESEEREKIALDRITLDKIICGEQQPESDHFVKSEDSWTGFSEDVHWREARGWFSYEMKNQNKKARFLYLKYLKENNPRKFDIYINNRKIAAVNPSSDEGSLFLVTTYPLPEDVTKDEKLIVKCVAAKKSMTAKLVEIRLLEEEIK